MNDLVLGYDLEGATATYCPCDVAALPAPGLADRTDEILRGLLVASSSTNFDGNLNLCLLRLLASEDSFHLLHVGVREQGRVERRRPSDDHGHRKGAEVSNLCVPPL